MKMRIQTNGSAPGRGAAALPRGVAIGRRGGAVFVAAALAALAPVAAGALAPPTTWKSEERDVRIVTDHGIAVSASVPEVVRKTAPFEIVVVVANLADEAVEITVSHGDDPLHPAIMATIRDPKRPDDDSVSLFPVFQDGWHRMGFISKTRMNAYSIPSGESVSFHAVVDWQNYPEGIEPGRYRMLIAFDYTLGDNTARIHWSEGKPEDPEASSDPPAHSVTWYFSIEVRDAETDI